MYGIYIYTNIWGIVMVNVTIYGIHGSYGNVLPTKNSAAFAMLLKTTGAIHAWWPTSERCPPRLRPSSRSAAPQRSRLSQTVMTRDLD